jgi:hypothetical protein
MTWPLALGIGRDVPGDLGDSLLNMWILGWGLQQVPRLLTGAIGWHDYWNANIFHPDPLALALSEHLFGQTLQMLPVYAVTGNVILCYNLLFIASFALSGLGTYLLVRDLTGDRRAAFLAGLVYGFLPYRIASVPHLQVMSSQWMPFALYGLNRFIAGEASPFDGNSAIGSASPGQSRFAPLRPSAKAQGVPSNVEGRGARHLESHRYITFKMSDRWLALAGGTGALVMQNWSCGYYLLYFAPFVPLFCIHRMWTTGRLQQGSLWIGLSAAAAVTLACTLPFLFPYAEAQRVFGFERGLGEVMAFSANVWSYVTAAEPVRLWGRALRFYPHGEGETFLGFVPWLLSIVAFVVAVREAGRESREPSPRGWRRAATWTLAILVLVQLVAVLSVVIFGGFDSSFFGIPLRARTPVRLITQLAVASALLMLISPRARHITASLSRSSAMFFLAITILAMWLSLGPEPSAGDHRVSGVGLYGVLYNHVPGFNGVRVPARYAMIAGLFLAVLAGYGAKALVARRGSLAPVGVLAVLILAEGAAAPMEVNRTWNQNEAVPPAQVFPADRAPAVYQRLKSLPPGTVVTEFPFGDLAWEIRYVYYAAAHLKPITNGYSGQFPPGYKARVARLQQPSRDPAAAWQALKETGTTHVVFHPSSFADGANAEGVRAWLVDHGATITERFADGDVLFAVP